MFNLKISSLIFLVLGIIIGSSFTNLFKGCGNEMPVTKITSVTPSAIKKEVAKVQGKFQLKFDSLNKNRSELNKQLNKTESLLLVAKDKNQLLQMQVSDLIDKQNNSSLNKDTSQLLDDCDSLRSKTTQMIAASINQDSLHEMVTSNLEMQLKNRDSTTQAWENKYQDLQVDFIRSLDRETLLTKQNNDFKKLFKRQQTKHKLITAGVLVLSIAATGFLIHH